jgi:hypothetical protein
MLAESYEICLRDQNISIDFLGALKISVEQSMA